MTTEREALARQIADSELNRLVIFLVALGFGLLLLGVNFFAIEGTLDFFTNPFAPLFIVAWFIIFIAYQLGSYFALRRLRRRKEPVSRVYRYAHVSIESVAPTLLLFTLCFVEKSAIFLDSPLMFIYFVLIVLSALYLNPNLSLVIGLICATGYLVITLWSMRTYDPNNEVLKFPVILYASRSVLMLMVAGCASYVTWVIRDRYMTSSALEIQRDTIKAHFGQQVSKEIADALLEGGISSEKQEVSILFMDIRNFTKYVEQHDPEEVIAYQNGFFAPIMKIISAYGGITNQIMGDGLMATFGVSSSENHTQNAVQAGLEIIQRARKLSEAGAVPKTRVGIGIHTGRVVMGNIGNDQRKQFSVSGSTVVLAARLEQANKEYHSEMLVSEQVVSKLNRNEFNLELMGELHYHNIERPIKTYQIKV